MITFDAFGQDDVRRLLSGMEDQIPFAMALTLTSTAKDIQASEQGHLRGQLDRPTSFTVRSVRVKPATKRDLEARIWIRDEASGGTAPLTYLLPQFRGGGRGQKRHEKALQRAGILPSGWFTAPGKDVRLNRFGNITAGTYTKILSQLRASPDPMQNITVRSAKRVRGRYFVKRRGNRAVGIYQRTGKRRTKSILHFVPSVQYTKRLDFEGVADKVIERRMRAHMVDALERTIRTAGHKSARATNPSLLQALSPRAFL